MTKTLYFAPTCASNRDPINQRFNPASQPKNANQHNDCPFRHRHHCRNPATMNRHDLQYLRIQCYDTIVELLCIVITSTIALCTLSLLKSGRLAVHCHCCYTTHPTAKTEFLRWFGMQLYSLYTIV